MNMLVGAGLLTAMGLPAAAENFKVDVSNGKIPSGVVAANTTGTVPTSNGYKRGWTKTGWTVDKFSDLGNVLLAPTYNETGAEFESTLTLPMLTVNKGEVLSWRARSMYESLPDSYRVEGRSEGDTQWTVLADVAAESGVLTRRAVSLDAFAGREVKLRFTAYGAGYELILTDVEVHTAEAPVIVAACPMRKYFGAAEMADGMVRVNTTLRNAGASVKDARLECRDAQGKTVSSYQLKINWRTGQEINVTLSAPAAMDQKTPYNIVCVWDDGKETAPVEAWTFASAFSRRLFVDEGTGMWCVNCPTGTLTLNKLHQEYGDQLIGVTTHVNTLTTGSNDLLSNAVYFSKLAYRDIPKMMLNRLADTQANGDEKFGDIPLSPVSFGIEMTEPQTLDYGTATAKVNVRVAAQTDNSADRYRIGYVGIKTYYGKDNDEYYQRNSCALLSNDEYYYLPTNMKAPLCVFHNVSVTSDTAFTGITESLPATLEPGEAYPFTVTVDGLEEGIKLVVFVLDTQTGEMMNCTAAPEDLTEYDDPTEPDDPVITPDDPNAVVMTGIDDDTTARPGVYTATGIRVAERPEGLPAGLYIYNGKKLVVK